MTCGSCVNKWTEYYLKKGFSNDAAAEMASKLVERVERRLERENLPFEPMYLLEKAGEDLPVIQHPMTKRKLQKQKWHRMVFLTNWRATILWSFRFRHLTWIGRHVGPGKNPDYTQGCTKGTCAADSSACTKTGEPCTKSSQCVGGSCAYSGTPGCPPPSDPNSSQVSACSSGCVNVGTCAYCDAIVTDSCVPTCGSNPSGTCGYNCNSGYTWNGTQCVVPSAAQKNVGDGSSWVTYLTKKRVPKLVPFLKRILGIIKS